MEFSGTPFILLCRETHSGVLASCLLKETNAIAENSLASNRLFLCNINNNDDDDDDDDNDDNLFAFIKLPP